MTDRPEREILELPVLPLRDVVVFPHMVIPLFVGREKSIRRWTWRWKADKQHPAGRAEVGRDRRPRRRRPVRRSARWRQRAAAAEAARRHDQGAGRRRVARDASGKCGERDGACWSRRRVSSNPTYQRERARGRSGRAFADEPVRAVRQDQPQTAAGTAADAGRHRRTVPPGRHHCRASRRAPRRQAAPARNHRRRRPPGTAGRLRRRRDRRAADGEAHPRPRQVADGEEPARVLPQRADEGDPEGTRRDRRRAERTGRARTQDRRGRHAEGGRDQGARTSSTSSSRCRRCRPKPPSCATTSTGCSACRGRSAARYARTSRPRRTCSTPIITAWRRSRNASSNTSPCRRA